MNKENHGGAFGLSSDKEILKLFGEDDYLKNYPIKRSENPKEIT